MKCPYCGAEVYGTICEYCDSELPPQSYSGQSVSRDNKTVLRDYSSSGSASSTRSHTRRSESGNDYIYSFENAPRPQEGSDRYRGIALVLCVLFGYFGVHRFYAGRIAWGIVYFFTFGFLGVGVVVDVLLIALGKFKDKYGQPLLTWFP